MELYIHYKCSLNKIITILGTYYLKEEYIARNDRLIICKVDKNKEKADKLIYQLKRHDGITKILTYNT